jgi:type I restriction-modification system DNA methylase subunit
LGGAKPTSAGSPRGERGGVHQFYTPPCIVRLLTEMLAPCDGRIYDSWCSLGGMFVKREIAMVKSAESKKRTVRAFDMIFTSNHSQAEQIAA